MRPLGIRPVRLARFAFFAFGIFFAASLSSFAAYVEKVEVGFDGYSKQLCWTPVRFECVNDTGKTFEGQFVIELYQGGPSFTFHCPVSLPSPSRKSINVGVFQGQYYRNRLEWRLERGGRAVEQGQVDLKWPRWNDVLILGMTSRLKGINVLNGKKAGPQGGEIRLLQYNRTSLESLPDKAYLYEGVDAVFWGDLPPDALRPAQAEALASWVRSGGTLITWGGAAGEQLQGSWIESLLPVQLRGQTVLKGEQAFSDNFFHPIDLGKGWVLTAADARSESSPRGEVLLSEPQSDLLVRGLAGLGQSTYLAFDPTSPQFVTWPASESFLDYLLSVARVRPQQERLGFRPHPNASSGSEREVRLRDLQGLMMADPLLRPPSFRFVGLFLFFYILIVGPVNYIVLRYKKKLELTWITIPLIVLVFLGAEYALGRHLKGGDIVVNSVDLLLGHSGERTLQHSALFGLFSPGKKRYAIECNEADGRVVPYWQGFGQREVKKTRFLQQEKIRIDAHPMNMWTMDLFCSDGRIECPEAIQCDLAISDQGVRGTIDNGSEFALKNPFLVWMGEYYELPEIEAGESVEIGPGQGEKKRYADFSERFFSRAETAAQTRATDLFHYLGKIRLEERRNVPVVVAWLSPPPESLRVGRSAFKVRSEALLCLQTELEGRPAKVKIPLGQYLARWFTGEENLERLSNGEARFGQGAVTAELVPLAGYPRLTQVDRLNLRILGSNPSKRRVKIEVFDWARRRWLPVAETEANYLPKEIQLAGRPGIDLLSVLRRSDGALQARLEIVPPESSEAAAPPKGGSMPDHEKVTVTHIDLLVEGKAE